MVSFSQKSIAARPNVGQRLLHRREELELTLDDVAMGCNIQRAYLAALETGDFQRLPGEVYAKSFLRVYANFLRLPATDVVRQWVSERTIFKNTTPSPMPEFNRPVAKVHFSNLLATPKLIRTTVIGALTLLMVFYLGGKVRAILAPPMLEVASPSQDVVTQDSQIEIQGITEPEVSLSINGQRVVADNQGAFRESFDLQPGVNTIAVQAWKKHSQPITVYRRVVVHEPEVPQPLPALP